MISAAVAIVPLGLLRARPLHRWFNALGLHPKLHRRAKVRVTCTFLHASCPWRDVRLLLQGGNIPSRRTVVTIDASLTGRGQCGNTGWCWGWELPWGEEHINVLELRAVFLALKALLPSIQGRHVLVCSDSFSTVFHVNHQGGTRSLHCLQVAQTLLFWAAHLASLRAVYIPGIANREADLLSRTGPLPEEWRLHPEVVALLWA